MRVSLEFIFILASKDLRLVFSSIIKMMIRHNSDRSFIIWVTTNKPIVNRLLMYKLSLGWLMLINNKMDINIIDFIWFLKSLKFRISIKVSF